jgi:hypothetical protein
MNMSIKKWAAWVFSAIALVLCSFSAVTFTVRSLDSHPENYCTLVGYWNTTNGGYGFPDESLIECAPTGCGPNE